MTQILIASGTILGSGFPGIPVNSLAYEFFHGSTVSGVGSSGCPSGVVGNLVVLGYEVHNFINSFGSGIDFVCPSGCHHYDSVVIYPVHMDVSGVPAGYYGSGYICLAPRYNNVQMIVVTHNVSGQQVQARDVWYKGGV
jgi:hypothetical protein